MKNDQERKVARSRKTTLYAAFREWLVQFAVREGIARDVDVLMERLRHVRAGRGFGREEMNER